MHIFMVFFVAAVIDILQASVLGPEGLVLRANELDWAIMNSRTNEFITAVVRGSPAVVKGVFGCSGSIAAVH